MTYETLTHTPQTFLAPAQHIVLLLKTKYKTNPLIGQMQFPNIKPLPLAAS
ncbi:hypothetical protein EMIT013CA1_30209 [Bacillus sp. IT-13CA1]